MVLKAPWELRQEMLTGLLLLHSCVLPESVLTCLSDLALPSGAAEVQEKTVSSPVATGHVAGGREREAYIREGPRCFHFSYFRYKPK